MKILLFIHALGSGGAERVLSMLANNWANNGYDIAIVTYDTTTKQFYETDNKITLINLDLSGGSLLKKITNHPGRIIKFRRIINELKPDIVVSFIDRTNVMILMASFGLKIPVIVSERINPIYNPGLIYSVLRKILYKTASYVVVQNTEQEEKFKKFSKTLIIPNPIDISAINSASSPNTRQKTIIAAGRLVKQKGFDVLLESFRIFVENNPLWNLKIFGQGPEKTKLEKTIKKLNLEDKAQLAGKTNELWLEMKKASIFVLSSYFEGFPNVLIEAMACKCPVIATDCASSVRELIINGENGFITPVGYSDLIAKNIEILTRDEKLRLKFSKNAYKTILEYDIKIICQRWEKIFKEITDVQR